MTEAYTDPSLCQRLDNSLFEEIFYQACMTSFVAFPRTGTPALFAITTSSIRVDAAMSQHIADY